MTRKKNRKQLHFVPEFKREQTLLEFKRLGELLDDIQNIKINDEQRIDRKNIDTYDSVAKKKILNYSNINQKAQKFRVPYKYIDDSIEYDREEMRKIQERQERQERQDEVCRNRKERRQIIFSQNKGKGKGSHKPKVYNDDSKIKC